MSDTATDTRSKPASTPGESPDKQALAHVEKWLAIIREISRERQDQPTLGG